MRRRLLMAGRGGGSIPLASCSTATPDGSPLTIVNDSSHNAFPSVARLASGDLILVYRTATQHIGGANDGVINMRTSTDDGLTWSTATTIVNPADDGRDAAVSVMASGTVLVSYTTGTGSSLSDDFFAYVLRSTDNGATWSSPIAFGTTYGTGANHREVGGSPIIDLGTGTLMAPIAGRTAAQADTNESVIVVFSSDDGLTWGSPVTVRSVSTEFYTEPYVIRLPGGTLHMLIRRNDSQDIYRTLSTDDGATWSAATVAFGGQTKPSHIRLGCGTMIYASRADPNGDTIYRLSTNDGASWGAEITLDATLTRNVYAGFVSLTRSSALCVYGIEDTGGSSATNADIRSQVFTGA